MSWVGDGSQYVAMILTGQSAFDLPGDAWSLFGWAKNGSMTANAQYHLLNINGYSSPNLAIRIYGTGHASNGKINFYSRDATAKTFTATTAASIIATKPGWYHIAAVRSGATLTLYIDGASSASSVNGDVAAATMADRGCEWFKRVSSAEQFIGSLSHWGFSKAALTAPQLADLQTKRPDKVAGLSLAWYCPMDSYTESIVPLTLTNNGTTISGDGPAFAVDDPRATRYGQPLRRSYRPPMVATPI